MNVPIDQRIRQIEMNLERWRWLPRDLGERHILVNIPEYRLEVWDRGQVPVSMRVVVGKQDTQTPIFNDEMTHVVFSPYWNVPPDIAQGETLPEILKDPGLPRSRTTWKCSTRAASRSTRRRSTSPIRPATASGSAPARRTRSGS